MKSGCIFNVCRLGGISILAFSASMPVAAETAVEREVSNAPMPHEKISLGAGTKVHMVSLLGYLEGEPSNEKRLAQLKTDVDQCVKSHQQHNLSVKRVEEWPQYLNGLRTDTYSTKNFSITYASGWIYGIHPGDCSLLGGASNINAKLSSRAGLCTIDLVKKTTKGQCDFELHRKAAPNRSGKPAVPPESFEKLKNDPATAAVFTQMQAAMQAALPATAGPVKTILGIPCQPYVMPAGLPGDTHCVAKSNISEPNKLMVMERTSDKGIKMLARHASTDLNVGENLFTPHLAGGFTAEGSEKK